LRRGAARGATTHRPCLALPARGCPRCQDSPLSRSPAHLRVGVTVARMTTDN
jgi:hypothetical protein